jgi:DNA (cytosine-5)-methyltransferase 1
MAKGVNTTCDEGQTMIAHNVTGTLACSGGHAYPGTSAQDAGEGFLVVHSLRADGFDASEDGTGRGTPLVPVISHTLDTFSAGRCTEDGTGRGCPIVPVAHAFDARQSDVIQYGDQTGPLDTDGHTIGALASGHHETGQGWWTEGPLGLRAEPGGMPENVIVGVMPAVAFEPRYYTRDNKTGGQPSDVSVLKADASKAGDSAPHVAHGMSVRRLTPRECERLQGFPDDYTAIPYRGKPAADGPRYKALGNSMAVPVMRWIGQRIAQVDAL